MEAVNKIKEFVKTQRPPKKQDISNRLLNYGDGDSIGSGTSNGKGYCIRDGDNFGFFYKQGHGYGNGDSAGHGNEYGSGYGHSIYIPGVEALISYNGHKSYIIDEVPTIIYSVCSNIAKGAIIGNDLTLKECYIAKEGNCFAHGKTIKKARKDLLYKILDRDKSEFETLTLDSKLSLKDAIQCYRVITGACSQGVKNFCDSIELKENYTIREIINLTSEAYNGYLFEEFFNRNKK